MSQVIAGSPATKGVQPTSGAGMVVGAVVNKPPTPVSSTPVQAMSNPESSPKAVSGVIPIPAGVMVSGTTIATGLTPANGGIANGATAMPSGVQAVEGTLANTKEKTPMCLINELARYNKIQHQYTLTDEQGPAHKKTFYVKLKLGTEEYAADGASIKKAQHAAAAIALTQTQYKHPPPKVPKYGEEEMDVLNTANTTITPTVELNALAMKRGEPALYKLLDQQPRPQFYPPNLDFRGMYHQRYHYPRVPRIFQISLKVGEHTFMGEGNNRQAARHAAAAKALKVLRNLPLPNRDTKPVQVQQPPEVPPAAVAAGVIATAPSGTPSEDGDASDDQLKSEISLVHEIALKRSMPVNFEIIHEAGPPHMRSFVTRCTVGDFKSEGEGNSKKLSKKRSAERMLEELKKLPPLPSAVVKPKLKRPVTKKKNRNLIKVPEMQKADPEYGVGINPISRLIQIQQAKKEKEPIYTLVAERGLPRRREFIIQVAVGEHQCTGVGPNKKLAKRNAAEAMLQTLGYSRPSPQPAKPAIKIAGENGQVGHHSHDKKVTFLDTETTNSHESKVFSGGRHVNVPGVLVRPDAMNNFNMQGQGLTSPFPGAMGDMRMSAQTTAAIAQELLNKGSSPTAEAILKTGQKPLTSQSTVRPKQQLSYLADVLGFQVQFTDFPKGNNKNEFLSLVSLSTNPPQVSHGAGATIEASHDAAALTALKALSEFGLDKVADGKKITENSKAVNVDKAGAGDQKGRTVKTEP